MNSGQLRCRSKDEDVTLERVPWVVLRGKWMHHKTLLPPALADYSCPNRSQVHRNLPGRYSVPFCPPTARTEWIPCSAIGNNLNTRNCPLPADWPSWDFQTMVPLSWCDHSPTLAVSSRSTGSNGSPPKVSLLYPDPWQRRAVWISPHRSRWTPHRTAGDRCAEWRSVCSSVDWSSYPPFWSPIGRHLRTSNEPHLRPKSTGWGRHHRVRSIGFLGGGIGLPGKGSLQV